MKAEQQAMREESSLRSLRRVLDLVERARDTGAINDLVRRGRKGGWGSL